MAARRLLTQAATMPGSRPGHLGTLQLSHDSAVYTRHNEETIQVTRGNDQYVRVPEPATSRLDRSL